MAEKRKRRIENNSFCDEVPGQTAHKLCQPCSNKDTKSAADVYCSNCEEYQCGECSAVHETYGFMKNHKIVGAKEVQLKPVQFDMKGLDQCDQHNKFLKFFCEDENQFCCSICAIVDHRKCNRVIEVHKHAENANSTGLKLQLQFQGIKSKAEMVVNHVQSSRKQLNHDVKEIPLKIKRIRDNVIRMFYDVETSVCKKAKLFETEIVDKFTRKEKRCERHATDAENSLETIKSVYRNGTKSQQFIVEHQMEKHAEELRKTVEEESLNIENVAVSFVCDEKLKLPCSQLPNSEYLPGKLVLKCAIPEALNLVKVASIDLKKSTWDVEEPLYSGLDFLTDGRLVVLDNRNKKCFIFNEKLEKVGSYQFLYVPQSVVVVYEEEVAVTSANQYKIEFLHISKSNNITVSRTCKVGTKYDSICMKDDGKFVVGTIDETRPVRIVSLSGEQKDFSINFTNKPYPLATSICTYIRNSDKVVITDRYEHTVYIYDVATNTKVVVKDDQIKEPRGVAVGPSDCILVCSEETDSIVQISQTGRILSSYKLTARFPFRVCVSQNKSMLAVSNSCISNRKLQLFKIAE